jgi:hypothetical protein
MRPTDVLALACLILAEQPTTLSPGQGGISWGANWRIGQRQPDSSDLVVLGTHSSIPVEILASNRGKEPVLLATPTQAIAVQITAPDGTAAGRLTCEDSIKVHRVRQGATVGIETATASEQITLSPEDSIEAYCSVAQAEDRPFTPGRYRVTATPSAWHEASVRSTWWILEVREPTTASERKSFHLTEGNEFLRSHEYALAAKQFELAQNLDPNDITTALALAGTYERMTRYGDAAALIENVLSLAQQDKIDNKLAGVLTRRLAMNYVAGGKEEEAKRLLLRNGFTADEAGRFIARTRSDRANPR